MFAFQVIIIEILYLFESKSAAHLRQAYSATMQGFNMGRYIPPASEDPSLASGKVGGFNSQKGHPLGSRFSKAKDGIITVRFEMPFDVWCETCKPEFLIKQGIRFNAQKKKVGNYLSSPIFEFSMRHSVCGATISIRTDPENTRYVVSAGGRKKAGAPTTALDKDYGEILTEEERERRRNDAFAHLEGQNDEKTLEKTESTKIRALYHAKDRHWDDPYTANQKLRREFRVGRKEREASAQDKADVSERYGIGIELLDHTQGDADRAALIEYGVHELSDERQSQSTMSKPLFTAQIQGHDRSKPSTMTKADWRKQETTRTFQQSVVSNTNARRDPFNHTRLAWSSKKPTKRDVGKEGPDQLVLKRPASPAQDTNAKAMKLVTYDDSGEE